MSKWAPVSICDVLADGFGVGRIFKVNAAPGCNRGCGRCYSNTAKTARQLTHGYAGTRGAAMAAFAKSWRRGLSDVLFLQQMSGKRTTGH